VDQTVGLSINDRTAGHFYTHVGSDTCLTLFLNTGIQMKKALTTRHPPIDVYCICREVTEVMEKLHAADAETIPLASNIQMVNMVNNYVSFTTCES